MKSVPWPCSVRRRGWRERTRSLGSSGTWSRISSTSREKGQTINRSSSITKDDCGPTVNSTDLDHFCLCKHHLTLWIVVWNKIWKTTLSRKKTILSDPQTSQELSRDGGEGGGSEGGSRGISWKDPGARCMYSWWSMSFTCSKCQVFRSEEQGMIEKISRDLRFHKICLHQYFPQNFCFNFDPISNAGKPHLQNSLQWEVLLAGLQVTSPWRSTQY